jgi:hypothetical protein
VRQARDLYITLPRFGLRVKEHHGALDRLAAQTALPIMGVGVYYHAQSSTALLELRLDRATLLPWHISSLVVWACGEGLPLFDPGSLPEAERTRFYQSYLGGFDHRAASCARPRDALSVLARRAGNGAPECLADLALRFASGSVIEPRSS